MSVDKIETYSESVFDDIAIDKIMRKIKNISEKEAEYMLNDLYKNINVVDEECYNQKGYYSVRYAIMNKINLL